MADTPDPAKKALEAILEVIGARAQGREHLTSDEMGRIGDLAAKGLGMTTLVGGRFLVSPEAMEGNKVPARVVCNCCGTEDSPGWVFFNDAVVCSACEEAACAPGAPKCTSSQSLQVGRTDLPEQEQ